MIQTAITTPHSTFLNPIEATRNVTVRKSVYDLSDEEVLTLRKAFAALQGISDNRGYQYLASIHGLNQYYCPHGNPLFLIWHRPYVLMFEQGLQARSPGTGLSLPYWDWTSKRAQKEGIPAIFTDQTYTDPATKKEVPNPLYKAGITFKNTDKLVETSRTPGPISGLHVLPGMVHRANRAKSYDRFCPQIEQPHNSVHGWVGGTMGVVSYAAFDPVFWVHHCFIEKLFCDWQDQTSAPISTAIAGQVLAPFNKKTDDVWNYKTLGYRYAPEGARVVPSARALTLEQGKPMPAKVAAFSLADVPEDLELAELHFVKTEIPSDSFEVRVFFNQANPTPKTPTQGNSRYAGSLFTFGHGGCTGDPGHCKVPEVPEDASHFAVLRPEHHLTPRRMTLDVTEAVRKAKARSANGKLDVELVLVDPKGKKLSADAFSFEMMTLNAV